MSECSTPLNNDSARAFTLEGAQQWQQKSNSQMLVNGYYRAGAKNAKRIHLLHGTGFSAMTLAAMASQLPSDWSIWLTDVPGHGGSTQPTTQMPNWQKMANTVADAIYQQANVKEDGPLIGIGHSMGGVLTLLAANKYPDLFSEIILLDPVLFQSEMIIAQQLMRVTGVWRQRAMVKSVANRTAVWPNFEAMKLNIASKPFYKTWHPQVIDDYCPVQILVANKSYFFIPKAVKRAAKVNKHIQWQTFGQYHCFPMEEPVETAEVITNMLSTKR